MDFSIVPSKQAYLNPKQIVERKKEGKKNPSQSENRSRNRSIIRGRVSVDISFIEIVFEGVEEVGVGDPVSGVNWAFSEHL